MSVSDHRWKQAIEFGDEITRQFPNTKMAQEVLEMMETIQERSTEEEAST